MVCRNSGRFHSIPSLGAEPASEMVVGNNPARRQKDGKVGARFTVSGRTANPLPSSGVGKSGEKHASCDMSCRKMSTNIISHFTSMGYRASRGWRLFCARSTPPPPHSAFGFAWHATRGRRQKGGLPPCSRRFRVACHAKPLEGVVPSGNTGQGRHRVSLRLHTKKLQHTNQYLHRLHNQPPHPTPHSQHRPSKIQTAVAITSKEKALALEKYLKSSSGKVFATKHS